MKDHLRRLAGKAADPWQGQNLVREYLQARILQFLQESGLFRSWIFHGGTALRFLYGLPRFSEDLDFAQAAGGGGATAPKKSGMQDGARGANGADGAEDRVTDGAADRAVEMAGAAEDETDGEGGAGSAFAEAMKKARTWFGAEAYETLVKTDTRRAVYAAWMRFPGLLNEIGLSPHKNETLSVKIELDIRPPAGGRTETTVVRRHVLLRLQHYDKAALLAGKLHAVLTRPYTKGRDLYDLMWYLSDPGWPGPDVDFLSAALNQTGWTGPVPTAGNWAGIVDKKLDAIDWPKAVADVKPFVERIDDLAMMTREEIGRLLRGKEKGSGLNF